MLEYTDRMLVLSLIYRRLKTIEADNHFMQEVDELNTLKEKLEC